MALKWQNPCRTPWHLPVRPCRETVAASSAAAVWLLMGCRLVKHSSALLLSLIMSKVNIKHVHDHATGVAHKYVRHRAC